MDSSFVWLEQYLEDSDASGNSEEMSDDERAAYEEAMDAIGIADIFGESSGDFNLSEKAANIAKTISHIVDVIIEKIREVTTQFKLRYSQLHFKASMKKLGKTCLTQIQSAGVPKEYTAIVKAGLEIDQKAQDKVYSAWVSYVQGKISLEQYNTTIDNVKQSSNAAYDALMLKFDTVIKSMSDGVVVKTESVLSQYDAALASLTASEEAATKSVVKRLEDVKKTAAAKTETFKKEREDRASAIKKQKDAKARKEAVGNTITTAAHTITSALAAVHAALSKLLGKIATQIAHLGDKDLRHAAGSDKKNAAKDNKKAKNHNEEVDETADMIQSIFGEDVNQEQLSRDAKLDDLFDKFMVEAAVCESGDDGSGWDDVFGDIMESAIDSSDDDETTDESFNESLDDILANLDAAIA